MNPGRIRTLRARRHQALDRDVVRPRLLRALHGAPMDVSGLTRSQLRALDALILDYLVKLRGEEHSVLLELVRSRGILEQTLDAARTPQTACRVRAAEVLGAIADPRTLPMLVTLLTDHREEVRIAAARAAGQLGDPIVVPRLLHGLAGPEGSTRPLPPDVVAWAVFQIGPDATDELVAGLTWDSPEVRRLSAEVLGLLRAGSAVASLVAALSVDPDLDVRVECARSLGRIGSDDAVHILTISLEPDHDGRVRSASARALGQLHAIDAVPALVHNLDDPDYWVSHHAAAALAVLGPYAHATLERVAASDRPGARHAEQALALARLAFGEEPVSATG